MERIRQRDHKGLQVAILLFLCFHIQTSQAQSPIFVGEDLVFYVSDSLCVLRGEYHFLNPSENAVKTRLFYPFPVSEQLPFPDMIEVLSLETGVHLPIMGAEKGVSFVLEIDAVSEANIHVEYWQTAENHLFDYILTSTQTWGRSLEWANYEIHVPDHLQLEYCSLDIDTSWIEIEKKVYSISRENYLPLKELKIQWGVSK
ncbi:MAG: hypothetical protein HOB84_08535 [Candidatus Marinimicrobia bacterium]|jgi:hypothetical protein|nr:hypothetical protein [Candidatus Neomarinimicrobiota bacterium]MBT3575728.1 hypothetical protein [Candidatus Neomarinimicrobiota bacterium]MBT4035256.1 hypothetical protein [Candidatus Neomarinimicrobiota bacterium]MBT4360408.1 hypothetical protein [Candidatus Neomarinimicrobiota bacterium]MBT4714805.1 hypothetical protein [Candidatus Neomarinimicrobiota bacterium]